MARKHPLVPPPEAPKPARGPSSETMVGAVILVVAVAVAGAIAMTTRAPRSPQAAPGQVASETRSPSTVVLPQQTPAPPPAATPPPAQAPAVTPRPAPVAATQRALTPPPAQAAPSEQQPAVEEPSKDKGPSAAEIESNFWSAVRDSDQPSLLQSYLNSYPNGRFAEAARLRIAELHLREVKPPEALKAPSEPSPAPESTNTDVAAVSPPPPAPEPPREAVKPQPLSANVEFVRALQRELKRVGCLSIDPDGKWGEQTRVAYNNFVKQAKLSVDNDEPSTSALDAATAARTRVCPLVCEEGTHAVNGRCVERAQRANHRREEPARRAERVRREEPMRERPRAEHRAEEPSRQSSGQKICFGARNELVPCR
jgi:hypothetical protein